MRAGLSCLLYCLEGLQPPSHGLLEPASSSSPTFSPLSAWSAMCHVSSAAPALLSRSHHAGSFHVQCFATGAIGLATSRGTAPIQQLQKVTSACDAGGGTVPPRGQVTTLGEQPCCAAPLLPRHYLH